MYYSYLICGILGSIFSAVLADNSTCNNSTFPTSFKFGAGTSAFQIEGGYNEDGKTRSWWDYFMNEYPQWQNNRSNGNVAADSYHRYAEDIAAMQEIGLDFYRFSLSWSRLLPKGLRYSVNQAGVDYYNNLIDGLIAAGIEPVVTIYHWDTPMALEHLGNTWTDRKMVEYFVDYADLAFSYFGDRVKLWATINEPKSFCQGIPSYAVYAFPELPLGSLEYLCGHHVLLAHAKTYRLYETKYKATQNGRVSITLDINYNMPLTNSTEDLEATERRNQFDYGWFAHPLVYGDYPEVMKTRIANNSANQNFSTSRLPSFTCKEKRMIKGSYDVFLVNTYSAYYVTTATYNNVPSYSNDEQTTATQSANWLTTAISGMAAYPQGIRGILNYIKDTYKDPEIIITENGYSNTGGTNDTLRVDFIHDTLQQVRLAMCEDGVNVTGYTYWSLLDNLEWSRGYRVKFGLVDVDFYNENRTRTLKTSAYYYRNVIKSHYINSTST